MVKQLLRRPGVQAAAAAAVAGYLRLALGSTRWRVDGAEHLEPFLRGQSAVVAFWHERLPLMPAMWLRARRVRRQAGLPPGRMHVLVSRHADGRFIGDAVSGLGLDLVHGSSSGRGRGGRATGGTKDRAKDRGGAEAVQLLLAALRAGDQVAITPDGPRGPRRRAANGVAQLAGQAGVPVLPVAAQVTLRRVLPTWDRMVLPLPGGRGVLACGAPIPVPAEDWAAVLPGINAALDAAAARADAMCGVRGD